MVSVPLRREEVEMGQFNPLPKTNFTTRRNLAAGRDQMNSERSVDEPGIVIGQNLARRRRVGGFSQSDERSEKEDF